MKPNLTNKAIAFAIVFTTFFNCSIESIDNSQSESLIVQEEIQTVTESTTCSGSNPTARITNNGTVIVDFEILTIDGTLLDSEYSLAPGESSSWKTFDQGDIIFSITNEDPNINDLKVAYNMSACMEFDMEIGPDNLLTTATPESL